MFDSSFFVTGILEEKDEYGEIPDDTPCLILWVTIDKPYCLGGNLDIDKTSIPVTITEKYVRKLGKLLNEGMAVAISGKICTFDRYEQDEYGGEVVYTIIELVATKVIAIHETRIGSFPLELPKKTDK